MQKDKLWKVEATICKRHQEDVCSMLNKAKIPYNYIEGVGKYTIFNVFCANQNQSIAVKEILKAYNAKYFVSESKVLWYLKKVLTNKRINVIIIIESEREVKSMRALKYRLENGTVVNSISQAKASGQKYEVFFEEIRETNRENISPIRKAMLEQFGYVHPSLKDKVVLD